ncbi:1-deoxy-D-xylulose-5-phosphate reductoisomerase [Candidatus Steffania adelgidicola]|uniref:1-deoxy-D-xylulose 5-phosphate reductoisomerase n=1 Tax=Candidatus Steffania adelgidicola str. Klausen-Leopoldsdorf TaxID=994478 RepID=G3ADQ6_9GAMM|nr:1-deoxy-D-xylulose-5-phosphate reductoisomerase [Candidatus Steffania adelgidicola]UDG80118.1 1-deoxy-D-xylulose 5-phosphate reductoisomerase [Candidatus Steffania adelgidicola]CCB84916.1 1-deoxy-D-xylulose 5-phosphate reductoisomerase [Candidatus Steffania adelgidicola str. Klausen-Leopoldsdorf]
MKNLTILGSTGSIGINTLSVVKCNPEKFRVCALVARNSDTLMTEQCLAFRPSYACMTDAASAQTLKNNLTAARSATTVLSGSQAACELAALDEVDTVMAGIAGAAGLETTLAALRSGKRVLLANKESLVICGQLLMKEAHRHQAILLPVDSEHNAIFQSLPEPLQKRLGYASLSEYGVWRLILTGSGGPFRQTSLTDLAMMTPKQACAHPNWSMGPKVSVDSATMMNKGLEYIEARWLFNAAAEQIEVLLHPQSIIHSMVRYTDGSILAQLGSPDMRTSIAHALSYPERIPSGVPPLDFLSLSALSFEQPDINRYPCLQLAIDASQRGQSATITLNAANEIAVTAFLRGDIRFTDIASINRRVLDHGDLPEPDSVEEVLYIDSQARKIAHHNINYYRW